MRIASLLPSATEILCALGLRDSLVAVSHECDFPADVAGLPRITRSIIPHGLSPAEIDRRVSEAVRAGSPLYQVDGDMLAALAPDLIVTQGLCDVCAVNPDTVHETIRALPEALPNNTQIVSLSGDCWEGVLRDLRLAGEAAGVGDAARRLCDTLRARWAAVNAPRDDGPTVAALEWTDPLFFGGHWVPEQIQAAGGRDVLGQPFMKSGRVSLESLIAADPDILLVMACGFDLDANTAFAETFAKGPGAGLRAVREGRLWALDANSHFSRPAPRLVDGVEILRQIFGQEAPPHTAARRVLPGANL